MSLPAPITYYPNFIADPVDAFNRLRDELAWVQHSDAPRAEYYVNSHNVPYTYGRGAGRRTYDPQPDHPVIADMRRALERATGTTFDVCFLNSYREAKNWLGWHADNSPEMDDGRPIAIVSLGAARLIHFREQGELDAKGRIPSGMDGVESLLLGSGSLCLMAAGMQDTHYHRIPKSAVACGPRISLTFRGYVSTL